MFRHRWSFGVLAVLVLCAGVQRLATQGQTPYEIVATSTTVTMRDGVKLATNVYRPGRSGVAIDGKFPVILERTPYNKDSLGTSQASLNLIDAKIAAAGPQDLGDVDALRKAADSQGS